MNINSVVLLLGKRLVNGQLTAEGRSRVELLARHLPNIDAKQTLIVMCGGITDSQSVSEAQAMMDYLTLLLPDHELARYSILLEQESQNTIENLGNAAMKLTQLPDQCVSVTLLSNDYHLMRIVEIEQLMPEQGLISKMINKCKQWGMDICIDAQLQHHLIAPYPHQGERARAFLLCDQLTTYRVYLEGRTARVFERPLSEVRTTPFQLARQAIEELKRLPLNSQQHAWVMDIESSVEATHEQASDQVCIDSLQRLNSCLTKLNRQLDPEAKT
ncbi:YdcF family protein [Vibrio sinaloensis]|uniref:YdcF family protein n=1 Tax=Photobacterium sp. (strain ATCC 43367) TaxID=379097 RepID=UPI002068BA60|nr:YdcF family protein [Vibrio sinaloensis]UPQ90078.1 YdcF family protein [Vibrio sinaloensis]